jgi:hypothetical protein
MPSTAPVQEWSNLWTDNYTTADYVAYTDTDAVFVTKVRMHVSACLPFRPCCVPSAPSVSLSVSQHVSIGLLLRPPVQMSLVLLAHQSCKTMCLSVISVTAVLPALICE